MNADFLLLLIIWTIFAMVDNLVIIAQQKGISDIDTKIGCGEAEIGFLGHPFLF